MQHTIDQATIATIQRHYAQRYALLAFFFATFGVTIGVQSVLLVNLLEHTHIRISVFSAAQLCSPMVSVLLLVLGKRALVWLTTYQRATFGLLLLTAAFILLSGAHSLDRLLVALTLGGAGSALLDSAMNAAAIDWEAETQRDGLNSLHTIFSAGAMVGALLTGSLQAQGWHYSAILNLIALWCSIALLSTVSARFLLDTTTVLERVPQTTPQLRGNNQLVALALICLLGLAGEVIGAGFIAIHLNQLGAPALVAGATVALFNGTMLIGRMINLYVVAHIGPRAALSLSALGHIFGGLLILGNLPIGMVGFLIIGLATAGVIPTVLQLAGRLAPESSAATTTSIIAIVYSSLIIFPPLVGALAEAFSLRIGLLIMSAAGLLMLALVWNIDERQ